MSNKKNKKGLKAVLGVTGVMFAFLMLAMPMTLQAMHADIFHAFDKINLFSAGEIEEFKADDGAQQEQLKEDEAMRLEAEMKKKEQMKEEEAKKEEIKKQEQLKEDEARRMEEEMKKKEQMKEDEARRMEEEMKKQEQLKEEAGRVDDVNTGGTQSGLPDLIVKDVRLDGQALGVEVANIGATDVEGSVHVYIWIDGNLKWTYSSQTLNDKSFLKSNNASVIHPQTLEGAHKVRACVDPNNVVKEINDSDSSNCLERTLKGADDGSGRVDRPTTDGNGRGGVAPMPRDDGRRGGVMPMPTDDNGRGSDDNVDLTHGFNPITPDGRGGAVPMPRDDGRRGGAFGTVVPMDGSFNGRDNSVQVIGGVVPNDDTFADRSGGALDFTRFENIGDDAKRVSDDVKREYEVLGKDVERRGQGTGLEYVVDEYKQLANNSRDLSSEVESTLNDCKGAGGDSSTYAECENKLVALELETRLVRVKMDTLQANADVKDFQDHADEYKKEAVRLGLTPAATVDSTLSKVQSSLSKIVSLKDSLVTVVGSLDSSSDASKVRNEFQKTHQEFRDAVDSLNRSGYRDVLGSKVWEELNKNRVQDYNTDSFGEVRSKVMRFEKVVDDLGSKGKDITRLSKYIEDAYSIIKSGEDAAAKDDTDSVDQAWEKLDRLGKAFRAEADRLGIGDIENDRPADGRMSGAENDEGIVIFGGDGSFTPDVKEQFLKHQSAGSDELVMKMVDELSDADAKLMLKKMIEAKSASVEDFSKFRESLGIDKKVVDRVGKNVKDFDAYVEKKQALHSASEVLLEKLQKTDVARKDIEEIKTIIDTHDFSDKVNEKVLDKVNDFISRGENGEINKMDGENLKKWLEDRKEESKLDKYKAGDIPSKDVSEEDWFYDSVKTMSEKGVVSGYSDGTFGPDKNIVVAEVAKMVAISAFNGGDGTVGEWYEQYISKLRTNGVVIEDVPSAMATRGLVIKILFEAFHPDMTGVSKAQVFSDVPASHPSFAAVTWAVNAGIIDKGPTFRVNDLINRAEFSKILKNVLNVVDVDQFSPTSITPRVGDSSTLSEGQNKLAPDSMTMPKVEEMK